MMDTNHHPNAESFYDLGTDLIKEGTVSITAFEDELVNGQLSLCVYHPNQKREQEIRQTVTDVEKVYLDGFLFDLQVEAEPFTVANRERITLYFKPPRARLARLAIPPISLDEGAQQILTITGSM